MTFSLWPNEEQELLLAAALGDREEALPAFEEWRARVDYEESMDPGSFRLLPLLYDNLRRLGVDSPVVAKLAGLHRFSWCSVARQTRLAAQLVRMLHAQDIPVMISKGLPAAHCYYPTYGLRPMSDIDLIVPREHLATALAMLEREGWQLGSEGIKARLRKHPGDLHTMHSALPLSASDGSQIDLHSRLLNQPVREGVEERFWRDAVPFEIEGVSALQPSPTHMLFHTIIHGAKPNALPPIRWIADAKMIMRRDADAIDWQGMARLAAGAHVRSRLGEGLAYLHESGRCVLPNTAVSLIDARACWVERIEQRGFRQQVNGAGGASERPIALLAAYTAKMALGASRKHLPRMAVHWTRDRLGEASDRITSVLAR